MDGDDAEDEVDEVEERLSWSNSIACGASDVQIVELKLPLASAVLGVEPLHQRNRRFQSWYLATFANQTLRSADSSSTAPSSHTASRSRRQPLVSAGTRRCLFVL
jgi:hypothetical protein